MVVALFGLLSIDQMRCRLDQSFHFQATGQLSVSFRNMSLKKIKRAEKKGTESVMDEKFALLFWSEFSIGSGEFSYQASWIHWSPMSKYLGPTTIIYLGNRVLTLKISYLEKSVIFQPMIFQPMTFQPMTFQPWLFFGHDFSAIYSLAMDKNKPLLLA